MPRKEYEVHAFCDAAFQFLASQIDSYYTAILRRDIIPQLELDDLIRFREIRTLMVVDYLAEPVSSTVIAYYLTFDRGTVSRATKLLKQFGYVTSATDPADRRSPLIKITKSGQDVAERYKNLVAKHFAELSEELEEGFTEKESRLAFEVLFTVRNRARYFANQKIED